MFQKRIFCVRWANVIIPRQKINCDVEKLSLRHFIRIIVLSSQNVFKNRKLWIQEEKRLKFDTEREREWEREREGGGGSKKYDGIWKIQTKTFDILVSEGGILQIIIVCMAEASN